MDFEVLFFKSLVVSSFGKTRENLKNRFNVKFIQKTENKRNIAYQSELSFNGTPKSYDNYSSYTFKSNILKMEKPIYLRFVILELSKLLMYETYYDKLQNYHVENMLQLQYLDVDSFVLSMKSNAIVNDLDTLQGTQKMFGSNSDKHQKLFSNELKKVTDLLKIETPKNIWLDEFVRLRSKVYACNTGNDSQKKIKRYSKIW